MIGKTLGSYEILSPLGKGGMGEVWRARDSKLGRGVAIKTLPEEFSQDEERLARFEREAKLLASLNHPNIATIHGLEEHEGTRFLVLELVEGDTLADRLRRGAIPVEDSLKLALQIAEALEAAHEKGVIHRDLKPANIKITPDGKVKVLDFGLAKAFAGGGADASLSNSPTLSMAATQQGVILGTAAYMSPEQARGQEVDKRADIWAFGVVLFEMLTGRGTFDGGTVSDVLAGVLAKQPQWNRLPPNLHPRILLLLERCLEKEFRDRYHDVADARIDIQKALADPDGVIVQPVGNVVETARSPLPWIGAIVAVAMITAVVVWNLRPAEPRAVARFAVEAPGLMPPIGASSMVLSPDGSRIVYQADGQLHLRVMDQMEATPIPGTEGGTVPFFSSDGESLGFFAQGQVKTMALPAGAPIVVANIVGNSGVGGAWCADGLIIFGQGGSYGLSEVPEGGGTPELFADLGESGDLDFPDILPGGEWVLFTDRMEGVTSWSGSNIVAQSVTTRDRKLLIEGGHRAQYLPTGHLVYARDGALLAVGFDAEAVEVVTSPVVIVQGVETSERLGAAQYSVSDNGILAYAPATGLAAGDTLALVARDGTIERLDVDPRIYVRPRISPDGTWLVVESFEGEGRVLWIYALSGESQIRQLTFDGNSRNPIWTPDSMRITFPSRRDGAAGIYTVSADGGVAEPLTVAEEGATHTPGSWSPDGGTLAFTVNAGTDPSIWTVSPGEEPKIIFDSPDKAFRQPEFSPDGLSIAYESGDAGSTAPDIYVEPFPRTGKVNKISQNGGFSPVWSLSDGDELFYSIRGGIWSVDVPTLRAENLPIAGFTIGLGTRNYDITPNGEHLIMVYPAATSDSGEPVTPRINIVLNWFEELLERLPVP